MEKSTVYFTDFRCPVGTSQLDKLKKICIAAGIKDMDMDGKFVAIKMHFGELGNMAFLRLNYAKVIADLCREQGGMCRCLPECNTDRKQPARRTSGRAGMALPPRPFQRFQPEYRVESNAGSGREDWPWNKRIRIKENQIRNLT